MIMPTPEELVEIIHVFIAWGFNIVICGLCMIAVGFILLAIIWAYNDSKRPINPLNK